MVKGDCGAGAVLFYTARPTLQMTHCRAQLSSTATVMVPQSVRKDKMLPVGWDRKSD